MGFKRLFEATKSGGNTTGTKTLKKILMKKHTTWKPTTRPEELGRDGQKFAKSLQSGCDDDDDDDDNDDDDVTI
jgi:hypothetical protein